MSSRHPHHRPGTRTSSRGAEASDGLIASLLLPLRGAGIGWAVLFGGFGIVWMIAIEVFAAMLGWFALPGLIALVVLFYTLAMRFATACFNGSRAGDDEPDLTDVPAVGFAGWFGPGLGVLAYFVALLMLVGIVATAVLGPYTEDAAPGLGDALVSQAIMLLVMAPVAASVGLAIARGSTTAMFRLPSVARVMAASGGRYVVPFIVSAFAGAAPFWVVGWAQSQGGALAFLLTSTLMVISGYSWGATGASMGWLARVDRDAAEVLDGWRA